MRNKIIVWVCIIVTIAVFGYIVSITNKAKVPIADNDGKINGNYSIEGILELGEPYICKFMKKDDASEVSGIVYTDGVSVYGNFDIKTSVIKQTFNSFLLIKDKITYTWTSLQPIGYKAPVVKDAVKNASPQEQAQIVGTRDEVPYECEPWNKVDTSLFEIPPSIQFIDLKR